MGLTVGPATWHPTFIGSLPLGTFICGGYLFRKDDGIAWIVTPYSTEVAATWNGTTTDLVGNKCCVSDWSSLSTALTNAGLTPSQWFVPSIAQLQTFYPCRTFWGDTAPCFCESFYWSSTECDASTAFHLLFTDGTVSNFVGKNGCIRARAFRCVTY